MRQAATYNSQAAPKKVRQHEAGSVSHWMACIIQKKGVDAAALSNSNHTIENRSNLVHGKAPAALRQRSGDGVGCRVFPWQLLLSKQEVTAANGACNEHLEAIPEGRHLQPHACQPP